MILNIAAYHFCDVNDPPTLAAHVRDWAEAGALKGTVLVSPEGINVFLAGEPEAIETFLGQLRADRRFARLQVKYSESSHVPFPRLKVKLKSEIISFRRDDAQPLSFARAPAVAPVDLARWIEQGHDDQGKPLVLLDTRNAQEIEYGTFADAVTFPIAKFTELPMHVERNRDAWEDATVVSFCTGGIRCEKAAIWMQNAGMDNVCQLEGGILGYFEHVGGYGYEGRCFVFDERVALDPGLKPLVDGEARADRQDRAA